MVRPQITAFFLSNSFLRLGKFRNISGIRQHLTANKGKEESSDDADSDSKKAWDREKPNGSYPSSCITPAADAFEPYAYQSDKSPNREPNNSASSAFDGP